MSRARGARDCVPEVVEPAVWVRGVLVRLFRRDFDGSLVDEDVRINDRVGDPRQGQGFEHAVSHHRPDPGVLDHDDFTLCGLDLSGHDLLYLLATNLVAYANTSMKANLLHAATSVGGRLQVEFWALWIPSRMRSSPYSNSSPYL